jgi:hypothetical protein
MGIFLFLAASRPALGHTQPPIKWVPGSLSLGSKRLGSEADHSRQSSAEFEECMELYLHSLNMPSWRGVQLKHRTALCFNVDSTMNHLKHEGTFYIKLIKSS